MKHKEEIKYWSEHEDGIYVWYKNGTYKWDKTYIPAWIPDLTYIVDNEWAELRKAQEDGKQLQVIRSEGDTKVWVDETLKLTKIRYDLQKWWRIKPEEQIYEWQWVVIDSYGNFQLTINFFKDEAEIEASKKLGKNVKIVEAYTKSKRIRK